MGRVPGTDKQQISRQAQKHPRAAVVTHRSAAHALPHEVRIVRPTILPKCSMCTDEEIRGEIVLLHRHVTSVCFPTHLASVIGGTHMSQHHRSTGGKEAPNQETGEYQEREI
jgi:hypothetical protein